MTVFEGETKEFARELEAEADKFGYRLDGSIDEGERDRNKYDRDYARILYSSSFRRLQGKMQLLGVDHTSFHRNRLTHSLEVAQIARTIASSLELNSPVVAEACSLAHDIGNPPFGHAGEVALHKLCKGNGGYEGNAQVIRIFRKLEKKYPTAKGLNLTVRTLLGLTKYFFRNAENPKKFLYEDDYEVLDHEWQEKGASCRRSIDVQIMDLSDEIAYAAHDLEDSLSMGYMSVSEVLFEFKINNKYGTAYDSLSGIVKKAQLFSGQEGGLESSEEYASVFRRELTSRIVDALVRDIGVVSSEQYGQQLGFKNYSLLSEGLKRLVFTSLLRKRSIQMYEKMGDKVIAGLFEVYSDRSFNRDDLLLPVEYRSLAEEDGFERAVVDYIGGMMDAYAIKEYERYFGAGSLAALYEKRHEE